MVRSLMEDEYSTIYKSVWSGRCNNSEYIKCCHKGAVKTVKGDLANRKDEAANWYSIMAGKSSKDCSPRKWM
jgi:hypothetical protein